MLFRSAWDTLKTAAHARVTADRGVDEFLGLIVVDLPGIRYWISWNTPPGGVGWPTKQ